MSAVRTILRSMADVEGVIGSFLVGEEGELVDTDLPATFDASVFAEAGPRLVRLADLGTTFGEQFRFLVLRFAEHKLFIRTVSGAFLGVILSLETNVASLKTAASLVAKRLDGALAERRTGLAPTDAHARAEVPISLTQTLPSITPEDLALRPIAAEPASEPPVSTTGPRRTVRFRGRSVD